jgi:hypothetical protein
VQQHLRRQAGVVKVDVSLVDGKVVIYPKDDFAFDPAGIFKAVYDSGVSVAEMTITANGELLQDPNRGLLFKVGSTQVFQVKPNDLSAKLVDPSGSARQVRVRGLLYRKPPGKVKRKPGVSMPLEILEVLN